MKINLLAKIALILISVVMTNQIVGQTDSDKKSSSDPTASAKPGGGGGCPTPPAPIGDTKCYFGSGCLDTSFASNGILQFFPSGNITDFSIYAIAVQSDGKIVGAGSVQDSTITTFGDIGVVRFNSDGSLDTSFGNGSGYIIDSATTNTESDSARAIKIQTDGKIVVGGATAGGWVIFRYNADGTRDLTFDGDGVIRPSMPVQGFVYDLALQSDGKILAGGAGRFTVLRLNQNGSPDSTFGTNGVVSVIPSANSRGSGEAYSLTIQTIGGQERIVLGGVSNDGRSSSNKFGLMRFLPNGAIDASFGSGGRVSTDFFGFGAVIFSLAIDANNKIVAGGHVGTSSCSDSADAAVARYNENGTLDSSFSGDGKVNTNVYGFNDKFKKMLIQPDGKIIGVGDAKRGAGSFDPDFTLVRYTTDGSADNGFGPGFFGSGIVTTGIYDYDFGLAGALQSDGEIIIAGTSTGSGFELGSFARYLP